MKIPSFCEWNPYKNREALENDGDSPHAYAQVVVGARGQWHLCCKCSELPKFNKFKKTLLPEIEE